MEGSEDDIMLKAKEGDVIELLESKCHLSTKHVDLTAQTFTHNLRNVYVYITGILFSIYMGINTFSQ